jgi:two-component system phosphate regulon sensor histidine kinase PhoR
MNRKKFIWLISMMLVSLIGIIWVQIIWISNAVAVLNSSFNHSVIVSLHDAASTIEASRKMDFFNDFFSQGMDPFSDTTNDVAGYLSMGSSYSTDNSGNYSIRITNQSVTRVPGQEPKIVVHDTTFTSASPDSSVLIMQSSDDPGKMVIVGKDQGVSKNSGGVYVRQKDFIDWVKKRSDELRNMSDQMISEIYQSEKTMELDKKEVEASLKRSLMFSDINTPFEFAVIKNGVVSDGIFKKSSKADFLKSNYRVRLFPDNIIRQDLILSVIFPERTNYILGSMGWILGGSLLFSLIILATFAMSLFFIIRQKKVSEMKSDFINNMTHEFKTPIATISLAADTITNPKVIKDESSVKHFISMIKKENSRMNKKVETILQIASLDKKEIDFKFENISLHCVIEKAVDTIEILVQQRNGVVRLNLNASEPFIYGDSEHLNNLVNNLLDNAIKYSPESPDITVETWNVDRGIVMSVEDKGIGMSKTIQSRIFERFYRQTSGNVHDVKGFGLGLNYSRAIVEAHRGTITVNSEPGRGTRFEVFLPFNWDN